MGKSEIIEEMSQETGLTKVDCEKALDAFAGIFKKSLVDGDKILIKGFMSAEVIERQERKGRNPNTGEVTTFPATKTVKCKVSQSIKDAVNEK